MADAAIAPATELVKLSINPISRYFDYVLHYKSTIKEVVNKLEDLAALKDDIHQKIDVARARGDAVHRVAVRWIEKVERIHTEVTLLDEKSQKINRWFKGWLYARYSLGKKAVEKTNMVVDLLNEGQNLDQISDPWLGPTPEEQVSIEGFEEFASTKLAVDQVMDALNNEEVNVVGVHGMGGIGKTTLMKHVSNLVKAQKLYDVVSMVTVSQNVNLRKIQDEIAADLRLELKPAASDKVRADHLLQRLKDKNRILIILDDLWNRLELEKVGIPTKNQHPVCKVVITTRRLDVCCVMKTEANVVVDFLSGPDSWFLFKKNAGRVVDDSAGLNKVARDVTEECQGLPIALVTLGRAMRGNYEKDVWQNVLQQLRESDFTDIEDMDARVFNPIKLSYDFLPSDEFRLCFLFCCLFPEDYQINTDELLRYVMGEGVLIDVSNWNQGYSRLRGRIIHKLTSSCLLLKSGADGSVMMHDIVRDVAIIIAKREHGFFVQAGLAMEQLEDKNKLLFECKRLSLMGSKITKLPKQPKFPNILTLSLSRCQSLQEIPDNFFQWMASLLTLDLSYTSISSLPKSLSCLILLRSLSLDGCSKLKDVSLIGKLKTLEIISLRRTSINLIPEQEIQEFANLKHLLLERESSPKEEDGSFLSTCA